MESPQTPEADRRDGGSGGARVAVFEKLGVLMTNTCINYQTVLPPVRGEHLAMGDTGVVIYSNGVAGVRAQFRGAGLPRWRLGPLGRTPRYGFHLDAHRTGTRHFGPPASRTIQPTGVRRGILGKATNSYWEVPVVSGIDRAPNSDELKHFGAALAGSGPHRHVPHARRNTGEARAR